MRRERTPAGIVLRALFPYVSGASFRRVKDLLAHRCWRSHAAVWTWVQKLGGGLTGLFPREELPDILVVDGTPTMERRACCAWVAPDPATRAVVSVAATQARNALATLSFLQAIRRAHGRFPGKVVTDDVWHPRARRLGIEHEVVSGGVRNYGERWSETRKDRARPFDAYVPRSLRCDLRYVLHWTRLVVVHCVRPHLSRGNRPPWNRFRGPPWRRFKEAVKGALT